MVWQMSSFEVLNPELIGARNAVLAENWWLFALRGVLAIAFGFAAFLMPAATMLALVLVFAAYSVIDGIFCVVLAVRGARRRERWGLLLLNGVVGIAIGIAAAILPGLTVLVFVLMVAAWALMSGALMLGAAMGLRVSHGRWLLVFGGIASIIFGVLLFANPLIGAVVLTWWMGAYALVFGVTLTALAFKLRKHRVDRIPDAMATSG